ncbi:MAG: hypothetical protein ACK50Q_13080 [Labrys sp. (in: a-proteobacteria)]|jgi:hypothetical protein
MRAGAVLLSGLLACGVVSSASAAERSIEEQVAFLFTSYADGLVVDGFRAVRVSAAPAVFDLVPEAGGAPAGRLSIEKFLGCEYVVKLEASAGALKPYSYRLRFEGSGLGYGYEPDANGVVRRSALSASKDLCTAESGDAPCDALFREGPALPKDATYEFVSAMFDGFGTAKLCSAGTSVPIAPIAGETPEETAAILWFALEDGSVIDGADKAKQVSESPAVFTVTNVESGKETARITVTRRQNCAFSYEIAYSVPVVDPFGNEVKAMTFDVDFAAATGELRRYSNEPGNFSFVTTTPMCTPTGATQDCYNGRISDAPIFSPGPDRAEKLLAIMHAAHCKPNP